MPRLSSSSFTRRDSLSVFGAGLVSVIALAARADATRMVVHKSATCGCCGGWAKRMSAAGFAVEEIVEPEMKAVKARLGVPEKLASCHSAEIGGYIIEGHVPAQAIDQLLKERPKAIGLAAPGMPSGSPGMEGGESEIYTLYLFDASGSSEYGRWLGDKRL